MRIVAGKWKRTPIAVCDRPGLRPTPDRVRETAFNWLSFLLGDFSCVDALDMFAGTGALGFEAASRGARSVLLVERDAETARALRRVCEKLSAAEVQVRLGDGPQVARSCGRRFALVFLDPPFAAGLHGAALDAALDVLAPGGIVYYESAEPLAPETLAARGLAVLRSGKAGAVHYALLAKAGEFAP